jgi:hypothetical protein
MTKGLLVAAGALVVLAAPPLLLLWCLWPVLSQYDDADPFYDEDDYE